jgi:hypothetical protein
MLILSTVAVQDLVVDVLRFHNAAYKSGRAVAVD